MTVHIDTRKGCYCGCGQTPGRGCTFRTGHDQRLIGILLRAARTDEHVALITENGRTTVEARVAADHLLSPRGAARFQAHLGGTAYPTVVKPRPLRGTVKVGRFTYPASKNQDGKVMRSETKSGTGVWREAGAKVASTFKAAR